MHLQLLIEDVELQSTKHIGQAVLRMLDSMVRHSILPHRESQPLTDPLPERSYTFEFLPTDRRYRCSVFASPTAACRVRTCRPEFCHRSLFPTATAYLFNSYSFVLSTCMAFSLFLCCERSSCSASVSKEKPISLRLDGHGNLRRYMSDAHCALCFIHFLPSCSASTKDVYPQIVWCQYNIDL